MIEKFKMIAVLLVLFMGIPSTSYPQDVVGKIKMYRESGFSYYELETQDNKHIYLGGVGEFADNPELKMIADVSNTDKTITLNGSLVKDDGEGYHFENNKFNIVKDVATQNPNANTSSMGVYGFYIGDNYKDVIEKCIKQNMAVNIFIDNQYYEYNRESNKFLKFNIIPNFSENFSFPFLQLPGINIDKYKQYAHFPSNNDELKISFVEARDIRGTFQIYFLLNKTLNINNIAFNIVVLADEEVAQAISKTLSKRYTQIDVPKRPNMEKNYNLGWQNNGMYAIMLGDYSPTRFIFFDPKLMDVIINYNMGTEQAKEKKRHDAIYDGI